MPEQIRCPFCNFLTDYPSSGKVSECLGECYTTYTLISDRTDVLHTKMRLVEIFFLDNEYNLQVHKDEIDKKCEFRTLPAEHHDEYILFAREKRVVEEEIEKLKAATNAETDVGVDTLERLHSSLMRFERDLRDQDYPREKLVNEIKVVETLVKIIRKKLENPPESE